MTSKFEQLIEYVINDEEAKAKELFHDIVVEKSREIYENLMDESQELGEESHDEKADNRAERDAKKVKKDLEYDYKHGRKVDENLVPVPAGGMEEEMGGDASDELINDVEAEEQGSMQEDEESDVEFDDEAEDDGEDLTHDMEKDHDDGADIEDRVVDLEDKLDELMAEFESLMGDDGDSVDDMSGGDDLEMDDTDTADFGMDDEEVEMGMMEAVSLSKVAPAKMGDDGANTKSVVPQNSGAKGAMAHPVKMTGDTAQGRPAPKTGELIGKVQNSVGGNKTMSPATKPVTAQASGVNTKTPFPKA
jgi:hypothetical protein